MPTKHHSIVSVIGRHPVHAISEFADAAARNAHVYTAADIGKVVQTGTGVGRQYWLIYDVVAGVGAFRELGGGGSAAWNPDAAPLVAHACDDEMQGGAIDAKWGTWDPGSVVSAWSMDTTRKMLAAQSTTTAGLRNAGRYQAIPASEFTAYTKCNLLTDIDYTTDTNQWVGSGLFVAGDIVSNPTTAAFFTAGVLYITGANTGQYAQSWNWTNHSTLGVNVERPGPFPYYRLRVNGTSVSAEASCDGLSWLLIRSGTLSFTPAYFGLVLNHYNNITGVNLNPRWQFFRCFSGAGSSAYNANSIGRYI